MVKDKRETQACGKLFVDNALYKSIAKQTQEIRKTRGLSVPHLSKLSGVNTSTIKNFESGDPFSTASFYGIISALKIEPSMLLPPHGGRELPLPKPMPKAVVSELMKQQKSLDEQSTQIRDAIVLMSRLSRLDQEKPGDQPKMLDDPASDGPMNSGAFLPHFGRRIRNVRLWRAGALHELGLRVQISPAAILMIEAGMRNPSLETTYQLAEGLALSVDFLFSFSPQIAPQLAALEFRAAISLADNHLKKLNDIGLSLDYIRSAIQMGRQNLDGKLF